jgi:large subunit ribosomal protein L33
MAKASARVKVKLRSSKSGYVYHTSKNKRNDPERMEIVKYDPVVREHVSFKEEK